MIHKISDCATIFDIQRTSYVDGPGIRTTVFFKGCNLRCKWCHNPESQSFEKQILFYKSKCTHCGRCENLSLDNTDFLCFNDAKEICGKQYSKDELLKEILCDKELFENSGGGVTFSGGECMLNIGILCEILKMCNKHNINTAVDTAGNVPFSYFEKILPYTDIFLYDIKCISENLHIQGTGVSNALILCNLEKLTKTFDGDIIIRIPIIPGFNDTVEEFGKIKSFLKGKKIKDVELLPYHKMGIHKYDALGLKSEIFDIPSHEKINLLKRTIK